MRKILLLLFLWGMGAWRVDAQAPKAAEEDPEFVEARRLFWSGQYDASEKLFKIYLAAHPKHEASKSFLQMIVQSRIYEPSKIDATRRQLEQIQVKQIQFKNADWKDVTARLQELANPTVGDKTPDLFINFINLLPSGFSTKISLDLKEISLMRAIEYACRQAGLRYVIDTWAVIIDLPPTRK